MGLPSHSLCHLLPAPRICTNLCFKVHQLFDYCSALRKKNSLFVRLEFV